MDAQRALLDVQGTFSLAVVGADNKVELRPVTLGVNEGENVAVLKGINDKDTIITGNLQKLGEELVALIAPIRERREAFAERPEIVDDILHAGNETMGRVARETIERVRDAMGMTYYRR